MIEIVCTRQWSWEQMRPHWNDIDSAIKKYVKRFAENVRYEEIINDIRTGEKDLWVVLKCGKIVAFIVVEIITTYTNKKRLIICHFGGKLDNYVRAGLDRIDSYARENGIAQIQFMGRKGWRKMVAAHGYRVVMMDYRKDIDCGMEYT